MDAEEIVLRVEYQPDRQCWAAYFTEKGLKSTVIGGGPGLGISADLAILQLEKNYPNTWAAYEHVPLEIKR